MRLLSLRIENFGKLRDYELDFSKNPTIILEDNGWGKTTLATFIKVMFFGFSGEQKRGLENNERRFYFPWNKGIYGGTIAFETAGREYEISRTFGSKSSDDTARLINLFTKLESSDFNTDKLGEELFNIDEASFERTVFLGQGKISVRNDKNNIEDRIAAKIGNLTDATDDVNNYDKVSTKLKDRLNSLKYGNKMGEINQINARLTELQFNINKKDAILTEAKEIEEKLVSEREAVKLNKSEIARLDEEYKKMIGLVAEYKTKKEAILELYNGICEAKNELDEDMKFFSGKEIEVSFIDECMQKAREIDSVKAVIDENTVTKSEENKDNNNLQRDDVLNIIDKWKKAEKLSNDVQNNTRYLDSMRYNREMDRMRQEEDWIRNQNQRRAMHEQNTALRKRQDAIIAGIISSFGIILVVLGIALMQLWAGVFGGIITVLGIVFAIIRMSIRCDFVEEVMPEFYTDDTAIDNISYTIEVMKDDINRLTNDVMDYCYKSGLDFNPDTVERSLNSLISNSKEETFNQEKEEKCAKAKERLNEICFYLNESFKKMGLVTGGDYVDTLSKAKEKLILINNKKDELKRKEAWYEEKEKELDEYNVSELENPRSADELNLIKSELLSMIDTHNSNITNYKTKFEEKMRLIEDIENDEQEFASLKEKLKEKNHKYDIIQQTKEFLDKAKEALNSRYMEPISDAYTKYYSFISTDELDQFEIDAGINVTKKEQGMARDVVSLSQGCRDLTDISLRMALVDVMYKEEKPFIVMDDPFVNLDQAKVDKARDFIKEVAKDYQVIYFTCHSSRA